MADNVAYYEVELDGDSSIRVELDGDNSADLTVEDQINMLTNADYLPLINKPSINGVELVGDKTSAELGIDRTYVHIQSQASAVWTISHGLDKRPSVTVVDSAGSVVIGDVLYVDDDTVTLTFRGAFSGAAYLN